MIEENLFYTHHYYRLRQVWEQNDFLEKLDQADLVELILPTLLLLSERIFLLISKGEEFKEFGSIVPEENTINARLWESLSKEDRYSNSKTKDIIDNIFTKAIFSLCERIFFKNHIEDSTNSLQPLVRIWLEDNLAKTISRDNRFKSYSLIRQLMRQTEMLHVFYDSFIRVIPDAWIEDEAQLWTEVSQNPNDLLDIISSRTFSDKYFVGFSEKLQKYQSYSSLNYIVEATRYSDQAMFNEEYAFKNEVLLQKRIGLWMDFWDKLKLPFIQDVALNNIKTPQDVIKIIEQLIVQKHSLKTQVNYLSLILLRKLYTNLLEVRQNLSFYEDNDRVSSLSTFEINEVVLANGKSIYTSWSQKEEEIFRDAMQKISSVLGQDEIAEWVFSYKPKSISPYAIDRLYTKEIESLLKAYDSSTANESFDILLERTSAGFNLQVFSFLVSRINDNKIDEKQINTLINMLHDFIQSANFYWDKTFSQAYFPAIKGIGVLLSKFKNPIEKARDFIKIFKVYPEGWNANPIDYMSIQREGFVFCGAIMLLEDNEAINSEEEKISYYTSILQEVISQTRFVAIDFENVYELPLYLLGCVVKQSLPNLKKIFENEIINYLDNIKTIIKILYAVDEPLLEESVQLIKLRIDEEFNFERNKLSQKNMFEELEYLENAIKKLINIK